ncbi:MAG: hypothetical protein ACE5JZ_03040 [Kiloniellales bacterium]
MTALPAANYFNDNARTEGEIKQWGEDIRSVIDELLGGSAEADLTIATGAVTPTGAVHRIDTEAAASTDDLDTLTATNMPSGRLLLLRAKNAARTVVVKHSATPGAGQISLADGADFSLDDAKKAIVLFNNGSYWEEVTRFWAGEEITARAALTAPATGDELAVQDVSATAVRKITLANMLKVINVLTADATPDSAADYVATYDASAAATKRVLLDNLKSGGAVAQEYTKAQNFNATTLTDAANIAWEAEANQVASVTLAGNRTLDNPTNMKDGATYVLIVKQDATGSRTLSYGSAYKWPGGTAPTLSTGANDVDILVFVSDGTNMYGVDNLDFS